MGRTLILAHRYLGIALGLLMVLWCLSGMVMMYVPYPQLTEAERVQHLPPIDWTRCCSRVAPMFQVEMLGDRPVARTGQQVMDLTTGATVGSVTESEATQVAATYSNGVSPHLRSMVAYDQWTVQGRKSPDRPLFHFELHDQVGTEVYVSSVTGKVVQKTTASQRFWNWVGAVPHWLYFAPLRANGWLWSQVVVWSSLLGSFLTLTGLYVGIKQFKRRANGRWIPYRGFQYWHHAVGLCFGLFVLTWVVSGLISMNPWGFLEGGDFDEPARLRGAPVPVSLNALARSDLAAGAVQVQSAPLAGKPFLVVTRANGTRLRLDERAQPAPLSPNELQWITRTLGNSLARLDHEDEYYFTHHREQASLPAYLVINQQSRARYYLDPISGEILQKVDRDNQWYRWLHQAPHRFDFSAAMRSRPLWDLLTLTFLTGTTVVCAIGAYLGLKRSVA